MRQTSGIRTRGTVLPSISRSISHSGGAWTVESEAGGHHSAPTLVKAAGAWADQVAGLAGLPDTVVRRAKEILALWESGHHVAGRAPPPPADERQLALGGSCNQP